MVDICQTPFNNCFHNRGKAFALFGSFVRHAIFVVAIWRLGHQSISFQLIQAVGEDICGDFLR